jgi:energy-coupling factor transporter ATP-binding protein EcfA2
MSGSIQFVHVVGRQGVGKSQLILALAAYYASKGRVCAGQDPDVFWSRADAQREKPGADVYFIECDKESDLRAMPGELVIRMEHVPHPESRAG